MFNNRDKGMQWIELRRFREVHKGSSIRAQELINLFG